MARAKKVEPKKRTSEPGRTIEAREQQLIALANDLAEKQLLEGTATSQVMTHFLKLGTSLANLERVKLENENKLLEAKVESIKSGEELKELYAEALRAMHTYSGNDQEEFDESEIV